MASKRAIELRHSATPNGGVVGQKSSSLVRTAIKQCLREKRVSVRRAGRLWGCSKATVERDLAKGFEIRPLRSPKTAECFARNVLALVLMRDAKPAPTASYVVRARRGHGGNVARASKARKLRKRAVKKRDGAKGNR